MSYQSILLLLTAGANLAFGCLVFLQNPKSKIHVFFSLMIFSIALWSFSLSVYFSADEIQNLFFWSKLIYISAACITLFFYLFTVHFPIKTIDRSDFVIFFNIIFFIAVIILLLAIGVGEEITYDLSQGHPIKFNPAVYFIYTLYFCIFIILSFVNLYKKYIQASTLHRDLIRLVFVSTIIAAVLGSIFNLFLPLLTYKYTWAGPLFTLIVVATMSYRLFFKKSD